MRSVVSTFFFLAQRARLSSCTSLALVIFIICPQLSIADEKADEIKALKTELLVAKTEQQAMQQLNKLLSRYKGTAMEPGLYLRKAELYVRQSKTERFFEISRDSETVVSLAPQKVKSASSKKYLQQAVETYEMLQRRFPNFDDLDMVLFNNAFTRQQLNQDKYAENLYRDLIRRFPNSELIPDSHLALGEMLFERKSFQLALVEFESIKKYPESRVYPYGLYKAGWTKYNLKDAHGALKELEAVVAFGKKVEREKLDAKLDLRSEALTDMILFFADSGKSENAFSYFQEQAGSDAVGGLILKLSQLYVRHSKHSDHEKVLKDYIRKLPSSTEVPLAYKNLIENYELQRNRQAAIDHLLMLDRVCEANSSWTKSNVNSKAQQKEGKGLCVETVTKLSHLYANKWHRMWKKNPTYKEFAESSKTAYATYLKHDDATDESHEARFAYAELLFQTQKYREASEQYALVATKTKNEKMRHDSGYAAIVSLEKAVADKWSDKDEALFGGLATSYLEKNKKGQYVTDIKFKKAFIAYEKGRYKEAAPEFEQLGWTERNTTYGVKAQNLYLDILNIQKRFTELREYSQKLLTAQLPPERTKELRKIFEESSFALAQQHEERGELLEAAAAYERFALENKKSHLADKSWWNAIGLYEKSGNVFKVTDMSQKMLELFPSSENINTALLKAAQGYEAMADLSKAATVLEELAKRDVKNTNKWLSLSADFYALSGKTNEAINHYRTLTKQKDIAIIQGAYTKLIALNEGGSGEERLLKEVLSSGVQPQASLAAMKLLEKTYSEKSDSEAFRQASRILEMRKSGGSVLATSRARLIQAKILEKEFMSQSVKSRGERLAMVLQIKTEKLDKATSAYQDVIRYGDGVAAVEALRGMANSYGHYVEALRTIELVGEYSKEELSALRSELENLSLPVEDKRIDTLQQALKQAKRIDIRDGTVGDIQAEINKLNMKRSVSNTMQIKLPEPQLPKFVRPLQVTSGGVL